MLLNLSLSDFNIKKDELFCDCKTGILVVAFLSDVSTKCRTVKNMMYPISKEFKQIVFAIMSVSKSPQIFDLFSQTKKTVKSVPCFMLFKQGRFERILNFDTFSSKALQNELSAELEDRPFLDKNFKRLCYNKMSEL